MPRYRVRTGKYVRVDLQQPVSPETGLPARETFRKGDVFESDSPTVARNTASFECLDHHPAVAGPITEEEIARRGLATHADTLPGGAADTLPGGQRPDVEPDAPVRARRVRGGLE